MGQRSQIYVKVDGKLLVANYYQWNYGTRMISRARYGIEWLKEYVDNEWNWMFDRNHYNFKKLQMIWDINFDYKDIVLSSDIFKEWEDQFKDDDVWTIEEFCYLAQDNNDGKLFVNVNTKTKDIKFTFTDCECKVLDPFQYMNWDQEGWMNESYKYIDRKERETCINNILTLLNIAKLMTQEEVDEFIKTI